MDGHDKYAYLGETHNPGQEPYADLDGVISRIHEMGSVQTTTVFAKSVRAWVASQNKPIATETDVPEHLEKTEIGGIDARLFRRLWNAVKIVRTAKGLEDVSVIIRRKALIELVSAYEEVIARLRQSRKTGGTDLQPGQKSAAKARQILYKALYTDTDNQKRMRSFFDYDMKCAAPYVHLRKHYGHDGIIVLIPSRVNEKELGNAYRFSAMIESWTF